jgi:endo-1,4-beta-xylanase
VRTKLLETCVLTVGLGLFGCSASDSSTQPAGGGGDQGAGGSTTSGLGGANAAGATTLGGSSASTGGAGVGGGVATGGMVATTGGNGPAVGGATGGSPATGGMPAATGGTATGGQQAMGGAPTGGSTATGGTAGDCTVGTPLTGGTTYCSNGLGEIGNGYSYEIWMDSGSNCATMYGVDAAFRADWSLNGRGDFLARAGLFFGSTQTHDEIGNISADYAFIKSEDNDFSWVAVYGWTFEPLMEYYIVEDWTVWAPATDYDFQGTITVDGGTYDIFRNRRINALSPVGVTDFDQFWSIRQEPRDCGHISISAHFNEWTSLGMQMGLLRESMLLVEALEGSGTVDFTSATVVVD